MLSLTVRLWILFSQRGVIFVWLNTIKIQRLSEKLFLAHYEVCFFKEVKQLSVRVTTFKTNYDFFMFFLFQLQFETHWFDDWRKCCAFFCYSKHVAFEQKLPATRNKTCRRHRKLIRYNPFSNWRCEPIFANS